MQPEEALGPDKKERAIYSHNYLQEDFVAEMFLLL